MNQLIKQTAVNFNELVNNANTTLSLELKTKMIELMNEKFTTDQQKWYIAMLYMYIHFHPTKDFAVNLDDTVTVLGFAHKKNAKRTLENNFVEGEDYKILLLPTEQQVKINGGAGLNKEVILMNVDTFKNMCMLVKTDEGCMQLHTYYQQLPNSSFSK